MAHLYPDVIHECKSPAEKELFLKFQNFSNDFHIIHSYPWLSSYVNNRYTPEGEIDFIILHKRFGILCLEIKGGNVKYEKHAYFNNTGRIKNPIEQARDNSHYLRKTIEKITNQIVVGYGIGFPHIIANNYPDENNDILFDKNDLRTLENRIIEIYQYWNQKIQKVKPTNELIIKLIDLLLPKNENQLNSKIEYDNKYWLTLSSQQTTIITEALHKNKFFVSGRAGSGKTILAKILARKLSYDNKVLFLTFNRLISEDIKIDLYNVADVYTFHKFLAINTTAIDVVEESRQALLNIIKNIENKYDILIIDEAQSFGVVWLTLLEKYFNNKKIYIFSDQLQVFSQESSIDDNQIKNIFKFNEKNEIIFLSYNYRSPRKVYERLLEMFVTPIQQFSPRDMTNDDLTEIVTEDIEETLHGTIDKLLNYGISKSNIVVLISGKRSRDAYLYKYKDINVETVQKYRGMEKPIIIYMLTSADERDLNELYVAYSRATSKTIIIIPQNILLLGQSHFEQLLIKSDITEQNLKRFISTSAQNFENDILLNFEKITIFKSTFYYKNGYFLFLNKSNNFVVKLLFFYIKEREILLIQRNLSNPKIFSDSSGENYPLLFDWCDKCATKTFVGKNFCANCNSFSDNSLLKDSIDKLVLLNCKTPPIVGKNLHDSLRTIGRYFCSNLDTITTDKVLDILNKINNVKYISLIIEFLIFLKLKMQDNDTNSKNKLIVSNDEMGQLEVDTDNKNELILILNELRSHDKIKQLNCDESNWEASTGYCANLFISHGLFIKLSKGKYKVDLQKIFIIE